MGSSSSSSKPTYDTLATRACIKKLKGHLNIDQLVLHGEINNDTPFRINNLGADFIKNKDGGDFEGSFGMTIQNDGNMKWGLVAQRKHKNNRDRDPTQLVYEGIGDPSEDESPLMHPADASIAWQWNQNFNALKTLGDLKRLQGITLDSEREAHDGNMFLSKEIADMTLDEDYQKTGQKRVIINAKPLEFCCADTNEFEIKDDANSGCKGFLQGKYRSSYDHSNEMLKKITSGLSVDTKFPWFKCKENNVIIVRNRHDAKYYEILIPTKQIKRMMEDCCHGIDVNKMMRGTKIQRKLCGEGKYFHLQIKPRVKYHQKVDVKTVQHAAESVKATCNADGSAIIHQGERVEVLEPKDEYQGGASFEKLIGAIASSKEDSMGSRSITIVREGTA